MQGASAANGLVPVPSDPSVWSPSLGINRIHWPHEGEPWSWCRG